MPYKAFVLKIYTQSLVSWFTFVFWRELFHLGRQRLVEALLSGDERLADGVVVISHHAGVAAHLVNERLQWHAASAALVLACAVLARLHGVRDAHGVGATRGTGGMGSGTQARRARGAGGRLGAHAAAGRGRSQSAASHAHQPADQSWPRRYWDTPLRLPPGGTERKRTRV